MMQDRQVTSSPDDELAQIVEAMQREGKSPEEIDAIIDEFDGIEAPKGAPSFREASGAFLNENPKLKTAVQMGTGALPAIGSVAGGIIGQRAGLTNRGVALGTSAGGLAQEYAEEGLGLRDETSPIDKTGRMLGTAATVGALGTGMRVVADPMGAGRAVRDTVVRPLVKNAGEVVESSGSLFASTSPVSGATSRVAVHGGLPFVRRMGQSMQKWANEPANQAFTSNVRRIMNNMGDKVETPMDTAAILREVAKQSKTPEQKEYVESALQSVLTAIKRVQPRRAVTPAAATASRPPASSTVPAAPKTEAELVQEALANQPRPAWAPATGTPAAAARAGQPIPQPPIPRMKLDVESATENLSNQPPLSSMPLKIAQPKQPIPPTQSKVARDAGEVLSESDVAWLAENAGIKVAQGGSITRLRTDIRDALLKARASRHTTHYENAYSDKSYRTETQGTRLGSDPQEIP